MEASILATTTDSPKSLVFIVKDPFGGKNLLRKEFVPIEEDATPSLDSQLWSLLSEELLLQIFVRLPVKDILRIRSLNKTWRSCITSSHFQAAFEEASLVRIALMVHDKVDGTMFLTQADGQECFRPRIARCPEVVSKTKVAATTNGLVCVIEHEKKVGGMLEIQVFVMNVVTGFRRALPHPSDMPTLPSFVQMDTMPEGGYIITFGMYNKEGGIFWKIYNSVENRWSKNDGDNMAHPNDKEVFIMRCMLSASFYEGVAIFFTKTKVLEIFDVFATHGDFHKGQYIAHSVHDVSGHLYRLGMRRGQHGVWRIKLFSFGMWELVCECPKLERTSTYLRVMNDVVVLLFKLPYRCERFDQILGLDVGSVIKVFHMPTKSWHSFPEKDYVMQKWGVSIKKAYSGPFLAEVKFDVVP